MASRGTAVQQVAVLGLGDFGLALAIKLVENHVSVLVVDYDRDVVELHKDKFDHAVIANFTNPGVLSELGIGNVDTVVLATSDPMETSILTVLRLKEMKVKRLLAKAENGDHAKVLKSLGVNEIIMPEADTANRVANTISWPHIFGMMQLLPGFSIMEIEPPGFLLHKKLLETRLREEYGLAVIAIRELIPPKIEVNPDPQRVITDSCSLIMLGSDASLEKFRTLS
ncbi:MAG TPA: TrkA family potassium uptake protein [Planctomycetota bacterium]|nr:TrkA family potassium uptake protein [Planctomycetota bacterium]